MTTLIRSVLLVKFSETMRTLGVNPHHMITRTGADPSCLSSPDLQIPEPWLAMALESAERESQCDAVGLLIAESWRLSDFGPISLLLRHQPTLRHALGQLDTYRHLLSESTNVHIEEIDDIAIVHQKLITERANPGRQPIELSVGALLALMRSMLGEKWNPRAVHFSHPAPSHLQIHRRVLGESIHFGSDFDGIVMDRQDLDQPNPVGDVNLSRYAKEMLDQLHTRRNVSTTTQNVRRAIHLLLPQGPGSIDQIGMKLGLSSRTLQRRLEQEGQDFSSLVTDVRRCLAGQYLRDRRYPVSQVAVLLGFAEVSTFSRWFSAQFGASPTKWRTAN